MENLRILSIRGSALNVPGRIDNFPRLDELYVLGHGLDLNVLTQLEVLTELYIQGTGVADITPLAQLTQLTDLWLMSNAITDISPLTPLTNLLRVDITHNPLDCATAATIIAELEANGTEVTTDCR